MGILKQSEPGFKTSQEAREFIKEKQAALRFWSGIKSVDTSEHVTQLKATIHNAKLVLMEMEKCEEGI